MKTGGSGDLVSTMLPVIIRFPRMTAPFKTCEPYKESKSAYKVLSVNFQGEKDRPELGEFRRFQESLQRQLMLLCMRTEGPGANALPNVQDLIQAPKKKAYSDLMNIKFIPERVTWVDEEGNPMRFSDIVFGNVDVELVAQLVDVFKCVHPQTRKVTYFPRYFAIQCVVCKKQVVPEFNVDLVELH